MTKSEKTRQFIIEKSATIFNKKGISGTSISDLMEATKLAKGGIYGNFDSKEEICAEAFGYLIHKVGAGLDAAAASKETAREKLLAILDYYLQNVATSTWGGCPLLNFGIEADDTNQELRQQVAKSVKKSQQRIINIIEAGKHAGEFNRKVDAEVFAIKMFTMIEGGIFTTRITNNKTTMQTVVNLLKKDINEF